MTFYLAILIVILLAACLFFLVSIVVQVREIRTMLDRNNVDQFGIPQTLRDIQSALHIAVDYNNKEMIEMLQEIRARLVLGQYREPS
jgi:hypothetical protein